MKHICIQNGAVEVTGQQEYATMCVCLFICLFVCVIVYICTHFCQHYITHTGVSRIETEIMVCLFTVQLSRLSPMCLGLHDDRLICKKK
jgi:hypothetical protein